ncbi:FAS-associated death domain protein-like [Clytia hemisphaerica]|uniref:FAS-associated death domain protein-like n=1 Tax=Clytia hemisphaerica TaxID=252671 RepID=UPI0034D71E6D
MSNNATEERKLFIQISKRLTKDDVDAIKFLYAGAIGEGVLEEAKTSLQLIAILKQNGKIENIKQFCEEVLDDIDRKDISNDILGRPTPNNEAGQNKQTKKVEKLPNELLEYVADQIAGDWKRFGRKLALGENVLEQIEIDNRTTYERSYQILLRWKKDFKNHDWKSLEKVLSDLPRYDIVRGVKSKFGHIVFPNSNPGPTMHQESAGDDSINKDEFALIGPGNTNSSSNNIEQGVAEIKLAKAEPKEN